MTHKPCEAYNYYRVREAYNLSLPADEELLESSKNVHIHLLSLTQLPCNVKLYFSSTTYSTF